MNDIPALLDGLRHSPAVFSAFMQEIPASRLHVRRGPGFWTLAEHAAHLAQGQAMLSMRIRLILDEDTPSIVPYFPSVDEDSGALPELGADQAVEIFAAERARQMKILDPLPPEAWSRQALHPEYERYGLRILARHMLMHDHWHMYRMEELWLTRDQYLTQLSG